MEGLPFDDLVESERRQLATQAEASRRAAQSAAELATHNMALEQARLAEAMFAERNAVLRGLRGVKPEIYICPNRPGAFKEVLGWDMKRVSTPRIMRNEDGPNVPYTDMNEGLALATDGRLFYTRHSLRDVSRRLKKYPEHRAEEVVFKDSLTAHVVLNGESHDISIEDIRRGLARLKARTNT